MRIAVLLLAASAAGCADNAALIASLAKAEARAEVAESRAVAAEIAAKQAVDRLNSQKLAAKEAAKAAVASATDVGAASEIYSLMQPASVGTRKRIAQLDSVEAVCVGAAALRIGVGKGKPFDAELIKTLVGHIDLVTRFNAGEISVDPEMAAAVDPENKIPAWDSRLRDFAMEKGSQRLQAIFNKANAAENGN